MKENWNYFAEFVESAREFYREVDRRRRFLEIDQDAN